MAGVMFHYTRHINTFFFQNIREHKELYILLLIDKNKKNSFSIYRKRNHSYNKNNFLMIKEVERLDYNQHKNPLRLFYIIHLLSRVRVIIIFSTRLH